MNNHSECLPSSTGQTWASSLTYLYVAGFVLLGLGIGMYTDFRVSLNDFWGNLFIAQHLDLHQPATWFSGFFPVGYAIFLRLLPQEIILTAAYVANIILMALLLLGIAWAVTRMLNGVWGLIATILVSMHPLVFQHALTPGADIGCAVWATLAGLLLLTPSPDAPKRPWILLLSGALFGLAALWRYHGLVLAFAFFISMLIFTPRPWRYAACFLPGLFLVYGVQLAANHFSGHGWLETSQALNVYKLVYGLDFQHIPKTVPASVTAVILQSPLNFLIAYTRSLTPAVYLVLPALAGLIVLPQRDRPLMAILALTLTIYLAITGIAFSPRGLIPLAPFFILSLVVLACRILGSIRTAGGLPWRIDVILAISLAFLVGLFGLAWEQSNLEFVRRARHYSRICQAVNDLLIRQEKVTDPKKVFTDSFELYLPGMPPYYPVNTGGWLRYDSAQYRQEYPALNMTNLFVFLDDCRRQSISHLALTPQSGNLLKELGQIYKGQVMTHDLQPVGQYDAIKLYRLAY